MITNKKQLFATAKEMVETKGQTNVLIIAGPRDGLNSISLRNYLPQLIELPTETVWDRDYVVKSFDNRDPDGAYFILIGDEEPALPAYFYEQAKTFQIDYVAPIGVPMTHQFDAPIAGRDTHECIVQHHTCDDDASMIIFRSTAENLGGFVIRPEKIVFVTVSPNAEDNDRIRNWFKTVFPSFEMVGEFECTLSAEDQAKLVAMAPHSMGAAHGHYPGMSLTKSHSVQAIKGAMFKPSDLSFMIQNGDEGLTVFIMTDNTDELRNENITQLPDYFGETDAENFWIMPEDKTLDEVKADLIGMGFRHKENNE